MHRFVLFIRKHKKLFLPSKNLIFFPLLFSPLVVFSSYSLQFRYIFFPRSRRDWKDATGKKLITKTKEEQNIKYCIEFVQERKQCCIARGKDKPTRQWRWRCATDRFCEHWCFEIDNNQVEWNDLNIDHSRTHRKKNNPKRRITSKEIILELRTTIVRRNCIHDSDRTMAVQGKRRLLKYTCYWKWSLLSRCVYFSFVSLNNGQRRWQR